MSQALREQLSALMDGELPRDQMRFLLRGIDADAELAQRWSRYQLASAVLRRQAAFVPVEAGFAERVMQRVSQQVPGPGHGLRVLRWAGGGAIAAAVAVVALLGTRPAIQPPTPSATLASLPAATMQRPQGVFMPIAPGFDYAQPASFDTSVISLPRYRYEQRWRYADGVAPNPQTPFVLLIQPPRAPATPQPSR
ncbi:MAG: sigma-E factor negative regulatory protein [Proteobacteria bacterium]|nr:sigma-E factor negative regulatory protein [Pseudomonadota bacterium]